MTRGYLVFWSLLIGLLTKAQQPVLMLPIGHTASINDAAFDPLGRYIVTASNDRTVKMWDSKSGRLIADLSGHRGVIKSVTFSRDGKRILTASGDSTVRIWDTDQAMPVVVLRGHNDEVISAQFSRDGNKILTASYDRTARIWDAKSGKPLAILKGHTDLIWTAVFDSSGTKVVTASLDHTARIWDATSGRSLYSLDHATSNGIMKTMPSVGSAMFSPDGKRILTRATDNIARLWDVQSGKLLTVLKITPGNLIAAKFSPDGKRVLTATKEGTVNLWDPTSTQLIHTIKGNPTGIGSAEFSPDGNKIVTTALTGTTAQIWDATSGVLHSDVKGHTNWLSFALFNASSDRILFVTIDKTAAIWDINESKFVFSMKGLVNGVKNASYSPDGKRMLAVSSDFTVQIWDALDGRRLADLTGHSNEINSANFSPDGSRVLTASHDATAILWDAFTGKMLYKLKGFGFPITGAVFSKDGNKVGITSIYGNKVQIWEVITGKMLIEFSSNSKGINSIDFRSDGRYIVVSTDQDAVQVWDVETGVLLKALGDPTHRSRSALYSPNGEQIFTYSWDRPSAQLWQVSTGKLLREFNGHTRGISTAVYSPDGKMVVTASQDATAKVWKVENGLLLHDLKGHSDWVRFLNFNKDGSKLITGSYGGAARIWKMDDGNILSVLKNGNSGINDACFSPDGQNVLTASAANTLNIWGGPKLELLYSFFAVGRADHLIVDASYRYDGSQGARKTLYLACGTELVDLDQLKNQLWVPNLMERLNSGERIASKALSQLNLCGSTPIVEQVSTPTLPNRFLIRPRTGGLGLTVLYVNGIEVKRYAPDQLTKTTAGYELIVNPAVLDKILLKGQSNELAVRAFTADNLSFARGFKTDNTDASTSTKASPNLYAVLVGVSDYQGKELDLKYAAKDALGFSQVLSRSARKLMNIDDKEHVFVYDINTTTQRYQSPSKRNIKLVLEEIGKKAGPQDILLLFFAGHGVMEGENKQFYFLTADASESNIGTQLQAVGISMEELSDWMKPSSIQAQKRILIFDACNSGQAIKNLISIGHSDQGYMSARGDDRGQLIRAVDRLSEQSGLFILSASASNKPAYEMGRFSQGLLTYSLLKAIKQEPDVLEQGKLLDLSRWFQAAERTVSQLAKESGAEQQPQIVSTANFNIGLVDDEVRAGIKLPVGKPVFTGSNLQNENENIASDDLGLNALLNDQLIDVSKREGESPILYSAALLSDEVWLISGRYQIDGEKVSVRINLRKGKNLPTYKFELSGRMNDLNTLANNLVEKAISLVK